MNDIGVSPTDAVEAAVIAAMARRADTLQGQARQWLLQRIDERRAAWQRPGAAAVLPHEPEPSPAALASLSALVDRLGRSTAAAHATGPVAAQPNAVSAFQPTWSRLRAERRLRQALSQVPAMAGPLNSSHVVNQALQAMHQLSPAYLDAFMVHIDTLQWLEQAREAVPGAEPAVRERPRRKA